MPAVRKMYRDDGYTDGEMEDMEKKIYDSFPETKAERKGCAAEKAKNEALRMERRKRLMSDRRRRNGKYETKGIAEADRED